MIKNFYGSYEATLDEKNRFVLPSKLRKCLEQETNELFVILAESEDKKKYIKILEKATVEDFNPLICDSLKLAEEYKKYFRINIPKTYRVALNPQMHEWLIWEWSNEREVVCIWLWNHIAVIKNTNYELNTNFLNK